MGKPRLSPGEEATVRGERGENRRRDGTRVKVLVDVWTVRHGSIKTWFLLVWLQAPPGAPKTTTAGLEKTWRAQRHLVVSQHSRQNEGQFSDAVLVQVLQSSHLLYIEKTLKFILFIVCVCV